MDDTISRQAAIDAVSNWLYDRDDGRSVDQLLSTLPSVQPLVIHCTDCEDWLERQSTLGFTISELPSAQQETHEKRTETHACDLISRAMLLEYIHNEPVGKMLCDKYNLDGVIKQLPSAQPEPSDAVYQLYKRAYEAGQRNAQAEIIRCKDCKHYQFADNRAFGMPVKMCEWFGFEDVDDDDFCSRAERRKK